MTAHSLGNLVLAVVALLGGCTAGSSAGTLSLVTTPLALTMPTAAPGTAVIDEDGLAWLDRFPYIVRVDLGGPELPERLAAVWPTVVPDEVPEDVEFEFSVPPGDDHELHVAIVAAEGEGQVATYVAPNLGGEPLRPLIVPGEETVVDVTMTKLPTGTVNLTWPDTLEVVTAAWVDIDSAVAIPGNGPDGATHRTELAVGRSYYPLIIVASGQTLAFDEIDVNLVSEGQYEHVSILFEK